MTPVWVEGLSAVVLVVTLVGYLLHFRRAQVGRVDSVAPAAHAHLRVDWFDALGEQPGSEILAVQTLRNSLMSATATASTALLALLGTVSLIVPSLRSVAASAGGLAAPWTEFSPALVIELALVLLLLASLVATTMAVRDYHHASFVGGMPVDSAARRHWDAVGRASVRRAGSLYGWGLRLLMLVAPVAVATLAPAAGAGVMVCVVLALRHFDRLAVG